MGNLIKVGNLDCEECELAQHRTQVVPNIINPESEIAILAMLPGKSEDKIGIPLVGPSGEQLDQALMEAGLSRSQVSLLNCCLCTHPENKLVRKNFNKCYYHLKESMKRLPNLKMVIVLGEKSYKMISGQNKGSVASLYMNPFKVEEFPNVIFVTNYHPAAFLHSRYSRDGKDIKKLFYEGIVKALEILKAKKKVSKEDQSLIIKKEDDLKKVLPLIEEQPKMALDTEFTNLIIWKAELLCISVSWEMNTAIGIPYKYWSSDEQKLLMFWDDFNSFEIKETFRNICTNTKKMIACQNAKAESLIFRKEFGFKILNLGFDTMFASHLLDSNVPFNLDDIIIREIPERAGLKGNFWYGITDEEKNNGDWIKKKTIDEIMDYCNNDAMSTWEITNIYAKRIME